MASDKTPVIEHLWKALQEEGEGRMLVMMEDVEAAIIHCNRHLGTKLKTSNLANFMKDIVRVDNASENWPALLSKMRITGRQRVGQRRVLEFIPFKPDQVEPFPNIYVPKEGVIPTPLQSISLPLTSKSLGRRDESWLIQVAVNLKVIEHHFAVVSPLKVVELSHLQNGVKLAKSEVDALFLARIRRDDGTIISALVTCEAKQVGERILVDQIVEQIVAANKSVRALSLEIDLVVPIAIKAINPDGEIYVVEFKAWTPEEAEVAETDLAELEVASEGLYRLLPPVPGVGSNHPRVIRPRKKKGK